jgi:general nucleoside transport system permease protein
VITAGAGRLVPMAAFARVAGLLVAAAVTLTLLLLATGHDPAAALSALVRGAFGSWYQLLSVTFVRAIPLALTGLAVAIAFRAGILNIGAEGQLLAGAGAAAALAVVLGTLPGVVAIPVLMIGGAVAGAAWAGVAAWLRRRFGVLEVISTIMLNFVALNIVGYLVRGPLQEPLRIYPQSPTIPLSLQLPSLIPGTRLHVGVLVAVILPVAVWYWLSRRAGGFRVRAIGASPTAAQTAGRIDVPRVGATVFVLSGAIAGLAGVIEYTGTTYALYENFSPGYGYTAIAVALLARLNPLGVLPSALLFGALHAGANAMQRDAGVPNVVVSVVNATLILLVLLGDRWKRLSPTGERGT